MDMYLSDYIKRATEELKKEKQLPTPPDNEHNNYEVWPEDQGDADHKRNPYSRV